MLRGNVYFEGLRKREKIVLLCLGGVLAALLICWHREIVQGLHSMKRRADVRRIVNAYGPESVRRYHVRGPLTIVQVETEVFGRPLESGRIAGTLLHADFARAWDEFRGNYEAGDELFFVNSDERSWAQLAGRRGYVIIRGNRVVGNLTTFLN